MKKIQFLLTLSLILTSALSFSQQSIKFDLHKLVKDSSLQVYNRELSLVNEGTHKGIRLSKDFDEGVAWIKGLEFSNGIIEFDVRGEDVKQHSFVGIAFHGSGKDTFDAIYLRPFQFRSTDETFKNRAIQYISLPEFTWQKLRETAPGKYEHSIEPAPDPNAWIKIRIVIKGSTVSTYINGSSEPSMVVEKVTRLNSGRIGFYVADTSGGDFANLSITKTE